VTTEVLIVDRVRLRKALLRVFSPAIVDRVIDTVARAASEGAPPPKATDFDRKRIRDLARRSGLHVRGGRR